MFQHTIPCLRAQGIHCVSIVTLHEKTVCREFSLAMQVWKCEELFRGLAVQVDWESWENTDSDGRDEHQECEIEISTVGRAERGEAREEWTAGGTDEEGQDRGVRQGEYIIMLVRGDKERGEKMRSDGLENGHLLALTVWYNTIWLVMIGGREEKHAHVALLYLEKIENSVWRKLSKESSAMHTQHLKEVTPDWNSLQCCQWGVCRHKTTEQTHL